MRAFVSVPDQLVDLSLGHLEVSVTRGLRYQKAVTRRLSSQTVNMSQEMRRLLLRTEDVRQAGNCLYNMIR